VLDNKFKPQYYKKKKKKVTAQSILKRPESRIYHSFCLFPTLNNDIQHQQLAATSMQLSQLATIGILLNDFL
jgi:hypothetical protein